MKRALIVLALVAGCEKDKPAAEPKTEPAATRPPDAAPAPASTAAVVVEATRVVVRSVAIPDVGGAIDVPSVETALRGLDGEVVIAIAPDATYQRLIDVMAAARASGHGALLEIPGKGTNEALPDVAVAVVDDEPKLLLTITTDSIILGANVVAQIAELPAGDEIPALRDAIAASPRKQIMLEADHRTRGDVLVRVIASAKAAGIANLPFLVNRRPSMPLPKKKSP